jgi:hypothetical protein
MSGAKPWIRDRRAKRGSSLRNQRVVATSEPVSRSDMPQLVVRRLAAGVLDKAVVTFLPVVPSSLRGANHADSIETASRPQGGNS